MRLNVYKLYTDTLNEITENERGQLGVDLFNSYVNKAVSWLVDYLTGRLLDDDQDPKALALMKTQKVGDALAPLLERQVLLLVDGVIPYPENWDWTVDLRLAGDGGKVKHTCGEQLPTHTISQILAGALGFRQVDILSHDKIAARLNSDIASIRNKPCAELLHDGFHCYPFAAKGSAFLVYLRTPVEARLAMTFDQALGVEVYDAANSVDLDVDSKVSPLLSGRIAKYFMQYTREQGGMQMVEFVKKS